jgi:hypothetical protein
MRSGGHSAGIPDHERINAGPNLPIWVAGFVARSAGSRVGKSKAPNHQLRCSGLHRNGALPTAERPKVGLRQQMTGTHANDH